MSELDFDTIKPPTKTLSDQRAIILSALRDGGELGCTLQHLCEAIKSSIETVALLVWELDEAGWSLNIGFDEDGIVWIALFGEPYGGAAQETSGR